MEEITKDNFKEILKGRHPNIFPSDKEYEIAQKNMKITSGKGYFYLLDDFYDLLEEKGITFKDIENQFHPFMFSFFKRDNLTDLMKKTDCLSKNICEMCGKKIETTEFQKDAKKILYPKYMRCKSCAVNPKKEFPISEEHLTKEEIKKYLTDDNYLYTTVKDFKEMIVNNNCDSKIINLDGKIIDKGEKFYIFKDNTGSIILGRKVCEDFLTNVSLFGVFPVYKEDGIHFDFRIAIKHRKNI